MSSNGSLSGAFSSSSDETIREVFKVIGTIFGFFVFLIILRVFCIAFIDVAILQDWESLMRFTSELRRRLCPWWHPRTQPQEIPMGNTTTTNNNNNNNADSSSSDVITMEKLLMGLTKQQKEELLSSILTTKIVSEEDIQKWKQQQQQHHCELELAEEGSSSEDKLEVCSTSTHGMVCPICINTIDVGCRIVALTGCEHKFHKDCLSQWLITHTRDCPYCRTEIISQQMLDEAYRLRRNGNM